MATQRIAIRSLPPSWNKTTKATTRKRDSAKNRRRHRDQVRDFIDEVVATARPLNPQAYLCPVRLDIWIFFGPDDDGDTDNRIIKHLQDALQRAGYFDDDCVVDQLEVHRVLVPDEPTHKTLVKLSPAPVMTSAQALSDFNS